MANAPDVTFHAIGEVRELHEFEATYKKPEDLPSVNATDGPRTIEAIDEYLWSVLGERKISLAYVIRTPDNQDWPANAVYISELKAGGKRDAIEDCLLLHRGTRMSLLPSNSNAVSSLPPRMVRSTRAVEIKLRAAEVIKNLWKAMNCHDSQLAKQTSDTGVNDNQTVVSTNSAFEEESAPAEKAKVVTKRRNAALTRQKKVNLNDLMGTSNAVWQSLCSMDTSVSMVLNKSITDLDSHADQCAEGSNALIVHDNDRPVVNVKCRNPDGPIYKDMQIVTGALAYNDSVAGKTVT